MDSWNKEDILRLDAKYANAGIHLHQRPFRAAAELLGAPSVFDLVGHPELQKITDTYAKLLPEVTSSWPGAGIGLAASIDQVRKIVLPVAYGSCSIQPWKSLGFATKEEWWDWCRRDSDIGALSSFAVADLYDFSYGLNAVENGNPDASLLWHMAQSNLADIANVLPTTFSVDSVIQPICLVAELVLKGTLVWGGVAPDSFRKGRDGHNVKLLVKRVAELYPHRDDVFVDHVASALPPYVDTRYKPAGLTRLTVVRLALGVQFLAASALRRISSVDLAAQMEAGGWPAPRKPFFPNSPTCNGDLGEFPES